MDISLFHYDILKIDSHELRSVAIKTIEFADEIYNFIPSSTTGLYHPIDELDQRGKVIHLKKCMHMAKYSRSRYDISGYDYEILKTACLIHDLPYSIYWNKAEERYRTNYEHPFLNARYLITITSEMLLVAAIYYHMGRWADYDCVNAKKIAYLDDIKSLKYHPVVLATQEADYYSSRRDIIVTNWYN